MSLKLKVQKREGPLFACDVAQLSKGLKTLGKERLVLCGSTLLGSLEPLKGVTGYVAQPPRSTTRAMPWSKSKGKSLYVSIDKEALALVVKARQKPVFALDALLRYGQRAKGADEHVVLGAFEGSDATVVLMLHFRKSELVALNEYTLAPVTAHTFEMDLHVLLERLRMAHAQASFHWCGPLSAPSGQSMQLAPASLWQTAHGHNLTLSGRPSLLRQHGLALGLVLASVASVAVALYLPYTQYVTARDALSRENSQLQGEYSFASEKLALLRARQAFFEVSSHGDRRLVQFKTVLEVLAQQEDLRVRESQLNSSLDPVSRGRPGQTGKTADFEVLVDVPRQPDTTALAQSRPLLQALSAEMGMNLRLATTDPYKDIEKGASGDNKARRQYRIQGDFNNAP